MTDSFCYVLPTHPHTHAHKRLKRDEQTRTHTHTHTHAILMRSQLSRHWQKSPSLRSTHTYNRDKVKLNISLTSVTNCNK